QSELKTQLALSKADKEVAHMEKARIQEEAAKKMKQLQGTISQLEGRVGRREQCLAKHEEQHTQRAASVMAMTTNFSAYLSANLNHLHSSADQRLQGMGHVIRNLERKLSSIARAMATYKQSQKLSNAKFQQLLSDLDSARAELQAKTDQNAALQSELQEARRKVDTHRKDLVVASNKILKLQKSEARAKQRASQLEA